MAKRTVAPPSVPTVRDRCRAVDEAPCDSNCCLQIIWAVGRLMWVRGPGYCQLIWADDRDAFRLSARCLQVATHRHQQAVGRLRRRRTDNRWAKPGMTIIIFGASGRIGSELKGILAARGDIELAADGLGDGRQNTRPLFRIFRKKQDPA